MSGVTFDQAAAQPRRIARLVLVTPDGAVVGALPEMPVALPWWQDAEQVVRAARDGKGDSEVIEEAVRRELGLDPAFVGRHPFPHQAGIGVQEGHRRILVCAWDSSQAHSSHC